MGYPGAPVIQGRLRIKYVEILFSLQFWRQKFRSRALFVFVFALVETRGCDVLPCTDCEEIAPLGARAPKFFSPGRSNLLKRPCLGIQPKLSLTPQVAVWSDKLGRSKHKLISHSPYKPTSNTISQVSKTSSIKPYIYEVHTYISEFLLK